MKIDKIVYDLKHLLNALTDDTSVNDAHLIFKINNYWALFLKADYQETGNISKKYYQRIPLIDVHGVSSADDPNVLGGTIRFGKFTMPSILDLGDEEPPVDIYTAQRQERLYFIERDLLFELIRNKDERLDVFKYYFYEENTAYTYPVVDRVSFLGLIQNPLEASLFYTTPEPLYNLANGIQYIVTQGSVKCDTGSKENIYLKGYTLNANTSYTYSGDGVLYRTNQVIDVTNDMEYPISPDMAERIILEILTKDFMLEKQTIADIFNDSKDQFQAIRSGG